MKTSESQPPHGDFDYTAGELTLSAKPHGPTQEQLNELGSRLLQHASLKDILANARHALLSIGLLEPESVEKSARAVAPDSFLAVIQDYTNHRTLRVTGSISNSEGVAVEETSDPPLPSENEFREALNSCMPILISKAFASNLHLTRPCHTSRPTISPMAAVSASSPLDSCPGILNSGTRSWALIWMNDASFAMRVTPLQADALMAALAVSRSMPGRLQSAMPQDKFGLLSLRAARPFGGLGPSVLPRRGTRGSGVELRYLDYKGKRVLYRAHVPILNVRYDNDACGPYRDWQNQEGMLQAAGTDVAPGFRLCNAPAKTILESGSDTGNYLGVAIYAQGPEVVLVSECKPAGVAT